MTEEQTYRYEPSRLMESYGKFKESLTSNLEHDADTSSTTIRRARRPLIAAAIQLTSIGSPDHDIAGYWRRAQDAVIRAAEQGATLILLPELFLGPYFCQSQQACLLGMAEEIRPNEEDQHFLLTQCRRLARLYNVALPISLFERHNNALYNSVVMVDGDGSILGTYRKSHIPDGTGYQEKFYFSPGDTGFRVFDTVVGKVGIGICWDQWFPEAARAMALQGADILLYPTAIGSEPQDPTLLSLDHWQRVMQGHAAANMIPVVASNRFGTEVLLNQDGITEKQRISFYGRSFITDQTGKIVQQARDAEDIIFHKVEAAANRSERLSWGLFRDRRPELYGILQTKDGSV